LGTDTSYAFSYSVLLIHLIVMYCNFAKSRTI